MSVGTSVTTSGRVSARNSHELIVTMAQSILLIHACAVSPFRGMKLRLKLYRLVISVPSVTIDAVPIQD